VSAAGRIARLRGQGRWDEAASLADDPLLRAELLTEQAMFARSAAARAAADVELDRAEARLELERGRGLHAQFLIDRAGEDPRELAHFEAALAAARRAADPLLEGRARFWIGLVHQVVRDDDATAVPHLEAAYAAARAHDDPPLAAYAIRHLAFAWEKAGRLDDAWRGYVESAALRRTQRFWPGVAAGLLAMAEAADRRGRVPEARRLLGRAKTAARRSGVGALLDRVTAAEQHLRARA